MLIRIVSAFSLILMSIAPAYALESGKTAPAFEVTDIAGKSQSLAAYKGKIVVLEWNNPDCPFVRKHYDSGNMQVLQNEAVKQGVVWLAINSSATGKQGAMDSAQATSHLAEVKSVPAAYILDPQGTLGKLYGATATPHMFVIDAQGNLAYQGAIDDKASAAQADVAGAHNYVRAAITSLKAGEPVKTASTTAYGCGVKYKD